MLGLKYWYYLLLSWTNVSTSLHIIFFLRNMEEVLVPASYDCAASNGKEFLKRVDVCMCITDLLCCTTETNKAL